MLDGEHEQPSPPKDDGPLTTIKVAPTVALLGEHTVRLGEVRLHVVYDGEVLRSVQIEGKVHAPASDALKWVADKHCAAQGIVHKAPRTLSQGLIRQLKDG